ncbi:MAG: hypothetical protein ACK5LC_16615 [Coprobacillaceae bacterium]
MERDKKIVRANMFYYGRFFISGLIVSAFSLYMSVYQFNQYGGTLQHVIDADNNFYFIGLLVMALIATLICLWGLLSMILNRVIVTDEELTCKKIFKKFTINYRDIKKIQTTRIRHGFRMWQEYKILTTTKTYEMDDSEFWGLRKAMDTLRERINRGD